MRLKVDVIVASGPSPTRAAKKATATIPIVMTWDYDPVGNGYVASLARPGGNITGLSILAPEISGKQLELLKEIVPKLSRVAVLGTSTVPGNAEALKATELAAQAHKVQLQYIEIRDRKDIETAFQTARKGRADAVLALASRVLLTDRTQVAGARGKEPAPGHLRRKGTCGSWGACDVWREHFRFVAPRGDVCGQDFERREARRSSGTAANEVRIYYQSESRQADRPDDSAQRAGAGGPCHKMT